MHRCIQTRHKWATVKHMSTSETLDNMMRSRLSNRLNTPGMINFCTRPTYWSMKTLTRRNRIRILVWVVCGELLSLTHTTTHLIAGHMYCWHPIWGSNGHWKFSLLQYQSSKLHRLSSVQKKYEQYATWSHDRYYRYSSSVPIVSKIIEPFGLCQCCHAKNIFIRCFVMLCISVAQLS